MQSEAGASERPQRPNQPKQRAAEGRVNPLVDQPPGSATKRRRADPRSLADAVRVTTGAEQTDGFEKNMTTALGTMPERTEDILKEMLADPGKLRMMTTIAMLLKDGIDLEGLAKAKAVAEEPNEEAAMETSDRAVESCEEKPLKADAGHKKAPTTKEEAILELQKKFTEDLHQKTLLQAEVAYHSNQEKEHRLLKQVSVVDDAVYLQFVGQLPDAPKPNARITVVPPDRFRLEEAGKRNARVFIADVLRYAHDSSQEAQAQLLKLAPEFREPVEARREEVSAEGEQWGFKEAAEFFLQLVGDDLIDHKRIALSRLVAGEPRQNNKPLFNYIVECRTLFARAGYVNVSEEMACEFFLRGLQRELQSRCLTQPDGQPWHCLDDLYQYARGQDLALHARACSKSTAAAAVTPLAKHPDTATAAAFSHPPRKPQGKTKGGYGQKGNGGRGAGGYGGGNGGSGSGHGGGSGAGHNVGDKRKYEEEQNRNRETKPTYQGSKHHSGGGRGNGGGNGGYRRY